MLINVLSWHAVVLRKGDLLTPRQSVYPSHCQHPPPTKIAVLSTLGTAEICQTKELDVNVSPPANIITFRLRLIPKFN